MTKNRSIEKSNRQQIVVRNINKSIVVTCIFLVAACVPLFLSDLPNCSPSTVLFFCLIIIFLFLLNSFAARLLLLIIVGFLSTSSNYKQQLTNVFPKELESKSIELSGEIIGLPEVSWNKSKFIFKVISLNDEGLKQYAEIKNSLIKLSCYECDLKFYPNQIWNLTVRLKQAHGYASWSAFDYEKFLFRQKIIASGYIRLKENNQFIGSTTRNVVSKVNSLRWRIRQMIVASTASETSKGILAALMIGDKSLLTQSNKQVFQNLGLSHLMAISGLHVGLVFMFTSFLIRYFCWPVPSIYNVIARQQFVLIPSLLSALAYCALAGFAISTQRALIMLSVFVAFRLCSLEANLLRILIFTAMIIVIYDSNALLDMGFWLSFNAVLIIALMLKQPGNKKFDKKSSIKLWLMQPLLWLGMLPVSVLFFAKISLVSPLVNLLSVPLFCFAIIPVALVCLIFWLMGLEQVTNSVLPILDYCLNKLYAIYDFINGYSEILWYPVSLDYIDWIVYLSVLIAYASKQRQSFCIFLWFVLLLSLNVNSSLSKLKIGEFEVTLLDVGQGLSLVVQTKSKVVVYDTGAKYKSGFTAADAVLIPYLRSKGIKEIDLLVISHADNDHIGGLNTILKSFNIHRSLTSRTDKVPQSEACTKGQVWYFDKVKFEVLSPEENTPKGSNNLSCLIKINNEYHSILLTGDIEKQVEAYLINNSSDSVNPSMANLKADVLLVPHQGSKTSSTPNFIDAVAPELAIVAAGYRNHYGHPHAKVVNRYVERDIEFLSTIDKGSIKIRLLDSGRSVIAYREKHHRFWYK